jgi:hypothetical protein
MTMLSRLVSVVPSHNQLQVEVIMMPRSKPMFGKKAIMFAHHGHWHVDMTERSRPRTM